MRKEYFLVMNNNYTYVEPMTREEKVEMYKKLNKKELIELLINANDMIDILRPIHIYPQDWSEQPSTGNPLPQLFVTTSP